MLAFSLCAGVIGLAPVAENVALKLVMGTPFVTVLLMLTVALAIPVIVVPLFLATLTMAGVCYGYLRLTTASVWPVALAHSAFNIYWDRFNAFTATDNPPALDCLAGESAWLAYRLPAHTRG